MAPFRGPSREQLLKMLEGDPQLPIWLGRGEPMAQISCSDGVWRLCPLVLDREKCDAFAGEELARTGRWMPEQTWQFKYEGKPRIEAATKAELVRKLKKLWWWRW